MRGASGQDVGTGSLRGASGHDVGTSGQDGGKGDAPEFSVAIAAVPPEVMSGLDAPGMISCDAGGSAAKREKPVGSVGGSCMGRSSGSHPGSAERATVTRVD
ncbi:hypothetical protein GCM10018965_046560 [Nonomuraea roseola]